MGIPEKDRDPSVTEKKEHQRRVIPEVIIFSCSDLGVFFLCIDFLLPYPVSASELDSVIV